MRIIPLVLVTLVPFSVAVANCGDDDSTSTTAGSGGTTTTSSTTTATGSGGSASTTSTGGSGGEGGSSTGGAGGEGGSSGSGGGGTAGSAGAAGAAGGARDGGTPGDAAASPMMNFFVSSDTSLTANLGGLTGADARCQRLAAAVGLGNKTWHAYLSAASPMTHARDRISEGPYYNSAGATLAATKAALHARNGDPNLFLTEKGGKVNGRWQGSPTPNEHDILTGTTHEGMLSMGNTCGDWTATTGSSFVGHSDGLGPDNTMPQYAYWNAVHTGQCGNTAPGGGAGRIYCFGAP